MKLRLRWGALYGLLGALAAGCGAEKPVATEEGTSAGTNSESTRGSAGDVATEAESSGATETEAGAESDITGEAGVGTVFSPVDQPDSCGAVCDLWAESDCPEGQKCTAVACEVGASGWDTDVCVDIEGDKLVGDDCELFGNRLDGIDDCASGSMCWNENPESGLGVCVAYCGGTVNSPQCADGSVCLDGAGGILPLCLSTCDPLVQDCAPSQESCVLLDPPQAFVCLLDASGGQGVRGTPCQLANGCNQGLLCIPAELVDVPACEGANGCCSPMCDTTAPNNCPGVVEECVSLDIPGSLVGVCSIPEAP